MRDKELKLILAAHLKWRGGEKGGKRADLQGADLWRADLQDADLRDADLRGADLQGANLWGANLQGADLWGADLWGADLQDADLRDADLRGTNLQGTNLQDADLQDADLRDANLRGTNLRGTNLQGTNLRGAENTDKAMFPHFQIPDGDIIGWKKNNGVLIKIKIPAKAKRTANYKNRKCRCEYAKILRVFNKEKKVIGGHDSNFVYQQGETVYPDSYNDTPFEDCTNGIHFFLTKAEAEGW